MQKAKSKMACTAQSLYGMLYHGQSQGIDLLTQLHLRPASSEPSPFTFIAQNSDSLAAMKRAEANPRFAMLSDWDHLTSGEYMNAEQVSGLDIL